MTDPKLGRPAAGTLVHCGISTLENLAKLTKNQLFALHGVGPKSLPIIETAMVEARLDFAQK